MAFRQYRPFSAISAEAKPPRGATTSAIRERIDRADGEYASVGGYQVNIVSAHTERSEIGGAGVSPAVGRGRDARATNDF
jgi:hypothetical protein